MRRSSSQLKIEMQPKNESIEQTNDNENESKLQLSEYNQELENVIEYTGKKRDRGFYAWMVCLATTYTFGFYLGFEFNYGLIYTGLLKKFNSSNETVSYSGKMFTIFKGRLNRPVKKNEFFLK
jgi:hypothetical protein